MKITIDSKLSEIIQSEEAVAMLNEVIPGFSDAERLRMALNFTLRFCLSHMKDGDSDALIKTLETKLKNADIHINDAEPINYRPMSKHQLIPGARTSTSLADKLPNILILYIDDMGWRDLACTGSSYYETPVIDEICREGISFSNSYAPSPVCSPSRASLLTGKYPARLGITDWIDDIGFSQPMKGKLIDAPTAMYIPESEKTLAHALKESGYQTWHVGKWHLGDSEHYPEKYGFDVNVGGNSWGAPMRGYFSPYGIDTLPEKAKDEYLTDRLTDEAIELVKNRDREKPFYLNLCHYAVHVPLDAKDKDVERFRKKAHDMGLDQLQSLVEGEDFPTSKTAGTRKIIRRIIQSEPTYAAMIWNLDWNVGRLMDILAQEDEYDNTVIIFTSDNGGLSTAEGSPTSNLPASEGKGWMYEGGTRVPLIMRYPHCINANIRCDVPVSSVDIYPTILDLIGQQQRPDQHIDGVSLVPLLQGDNIEDRPLYWHYPHYGNQGGTPASSMLMGQWKLIQFFEDNKVELYNLSADFSERNNVTAKYPNKAKEMTKVLNQWIAEIEAKMPTVNPEWIKY